MYNSLLLPIFVRSIFCYKVKRQILYIFMVLLMSVQVQDVFCQGRTKSDFVIDSLVSLGYENVRCVDTSSERIYTVEVNCEKRLGVGVAIALDVINKEGLKPGLPCRVIVTEYNMPKLSFMLPSVKAGEKIEVTDWRATYEIGNEWKEVRKSRLYNSSLFKVDINIYPQLSYKNMIITQIYQALFQLSPALETSFWPGSKFSMMFKIPIYNDGYGPLEDKIHPGHITLSQRFRLPAGIKTRATVGCFNNSSWGGDLELEYPLKFDDRFTLNARVGYTGIHYWDGITIHYDNKMATTWSLGGHFYWPEYNLSLGLRAEKFLSLDKGLVFDAVRNFRYASVGVYAVKGLDAKLNAGFRFQVLLPSYKHKRKILRIDMSDNMGIVYNSNNERYYYREYRAEASDNIMSRNRFNPYFLNSELRTK